MGKISSLEGKRQKDFTEYIVAIIIITTEVNRVTELSICRIG